MSSPAKSGLNSDLIYNEGRSVNPGLNLDTVTRSRDSIRIQLSAILAPGTQLACGPQDILNFDYRNKKFTFSKK